MYKRLALIALMALLSQRAIAAETASYRFSLPDHGTLVIAKPAVWQDDIAQPPDRLPPTLKLSPAQGPAFQIFITPLWSFANKAPPPDSASIRSEVENAAESAKPQAVEKVLEVKPLTGTGGVGYYFSATDRAPAPGEFKHLTQGILPMGDLVVTFTILTNDGQDSTIKAALQMLRSMAREGGSASR